MSFYQNIVHKLLKIAGVIPHQTQIQNPIQNLGIDQYSEGAVGWYNRHMRMTRDRRTAYYDYEQIADFVLGGSALDMYVEDALPFSQDKMATTWITATNPKIQDEIRKLDQRIDKEAMIQNQAYTAALYGDDFQYIALSKEGVVGTKQILPFALTRIEDTFGQLLGFAPGMLDQSTSNQQPPHPMARPYDIIHTRIISKFTRHTGHGVSMLDPVRYIWRQLKIMLDSSVLYRYSRGPNRRVFYIDVGTQPIEEQLRTVNMWRQYMKKKINFNPGSGAFDQEWNPESIEEDIFFPLPKGSNSRIETIQGSGNVGEIADIQLYINLFFAGLRIPKAFMGFEGEILAREVLPYQSIRYANVAYRLQRAVIGSLVKLYYMHLVMLGFDPDTEKDAFKVHTSTISHLYDVAKSELLNVKMEMLEKLLSFGDSVQLKKDAWLRYLLNTYLDIDDQMIQALLPPSPEDVDLDDKTKNDIHKVMKNNDLKNNDRMKTFKSMGKFFHNDISSKDFQKDFQITDDLIRGAKETPREMHETFCNTVREMIEIEADHRKNIEVVS